MHWWNPGGGGAEVGTHTSPLFGQLATTSPRQASADRPQPESWPGGGVLAGVGGGGFAGAQLASILGGWIKIDWTQGTPLQSCPLGIASFVVQEPSQSYGASNDITGTPGHFCALKTST